MNAIEIKKLRKSLGSFSLDIDNLDIPEGFVTGFLDLMVQEKLLL